MYNTKTIQSCTAGLIGFEQSYTPEVPQLAAELLESRSGLYYRSFHPLLTVDNLLNLLETSMVQANNAGALLSDYLKRMVGASTNKLLMAIFQQKKLGQQVKSLFEDTRLFHGAASYTDKIIRQGRFVGLELHLSGSDDMATVINQVGVQFDTAQTGMKLYLYQEGTEEPVWVQEVSITKPIQFSWFSLDAANPNTLPAGVYCLGYYEDDLQGQAINRQSDMSKPPCMTCNGYDTAYYRTWSPYVKVRAFSVPMASITPERVQWESIAMDYGKSDTNWGLNLAFSMKCDLTAFICRHSDLLTNALGLQVAVDLITEMAYSTRDNEKKQKLGPLAFAALENSATGTPGLTVRLSAAIKALEFDLSDFDGRCLPCAPSNSLRRVAM